MNRTPLNHDAMTASDNISTVEVRNTAHPPGTRDACPTKITAVVESDLWGSRLGCRAGGGQREVRRCRPADNPFASHRVEGLAYRFDGPGLEALRRRLEELGGHAAIVGPEGSGKTTLLEELASALPGETVWVWLGASCRRPWQVARAQLPRRVTTMHTVLIDGAEQLGPLGWRRFLLTTRNAGLLVATLHRPRVLPTLTECRTDRALLRGLVAELAPAEATQLNTDLDDLFRRHSGNIRLCLRDLYDLFAGRS
jgi:hypothetical protein